MGKKSFTWNPEGLCIFDSFTDPKSICLFDYWTIYHFYFTGFFYIILHHYFGINDLFCAILLMIILTLVHIFEEYLGNTTRLSLEGVTIDNIYPLINPNFDPKFRNIDNDYMENSIGDVLAGFISTGLIIIYWRYYGHLPYFYLLGIFPILYMLFTKGAEMVLDKSL